MFLNARAVMHIDFFRGQDTTFVASVCKLLKPCFAAPSDYVFREGELGLEMFFVQSGTVEILCAFEGGELRLDCQEQGSYFGEVALLLEGRPREASVRALTFCNMYSFSKDSLDYLLRLYPEVGEAMAQVCGKRLQRWRFKRVGSIIKRQRSVAKVMSGFTGAAHLGGDMDGAGASAAERGGGEAASGSSTQPRSSSSSSQEGEPSPPARGSSRGRASGRGASGLAARIANRSGGKPAATEASVGVAAEAATALADEGDEGDDEVDDAAADAAADAAMAAADAAGLHLGNGVGGGLSLDAKLPAELSGLVGAGVATQAVTEGSLIDESCALLTQKLKVQTRAVTLTLSLTMTLDP